MMNYLMLIVADIILAFYFAFNKIYQKSEGTSMAAGFRFSALSGFFTIIIFLFVNGFGIKFTVFSCVLALVKTILVVMYTLLGFRLLKEGSMALYTLFLMIGGMTVPYVFGLAFLDEEFSWLRTVALVVILFGVGIANFDKGKMNIRMLLMCVSVFVVNGFVSVISKIHQLDAYSNVSVGANNFIIIGAFIQFVICGICYLITKKNMHGKSQKPLSAPALTAVIILAAAMSGFSYLLQLEGAAKLPATVIYPVVTGGSIVFSSLMGMIAFKERPSSKVMISVCLCCVGTLMFL